MWIVEFKSPGGRTAFRAFDYERLAYEFAAEMKALHGSCHVPVWDLFGRKKEPSQ